MIDQGPETWYLAYVTIIWNASPQGQCKVGLQTLLKPNFHDSSDGR
jgi:hypothetical protein